MRVLSRKSPLLCLLVHRIRLRGFESIRSTFSWSLLYSFQRYQPNLSAKSDADADSPMQNTDEKDQHSTPVIKTEPYDMQNTQTMGAQNPPSSQIVDLNLEFNKSYSVTKNHDWTPSDSTPLKASTGTSSAGLSSEQGVDATVMPVPISAPVPSTSILRIAAEEAGQQHLRVKSLRERVSTHGLGRVYPYKCHLTTSE